jgi:hypothetical protein
MSSYDQKINELKATFIRAFSEAKGTEKVRDVCCRYFKWGKNHRISTGELVDYLGVSSPSVLDEAEYSDTEAQDVMKIIGLITDDEIESTNI